MHVITEIHTGVNIHPHTGIDLAGELLCDLIKKSTTANTAYISLISHSMGGLITRYCIGKLYATGYFDQVTPVNFVTLSTPHEGALITRRASRYYACLNRSGAFAGPRCAEMVYMFAHFTHYHNQPPA